MTISDVAVWGSVVLSIFFIVFFRAVAWKLKGKTCDFCAYRCGWKHDYCGLSERFSPVPFFRTCSRFRKKGSYKNFFGNYSGYGQDYYEN